MLSRKTLNDLIRLSRNKVKKGNRFENAFLAEGERILEEGLKSGNECLLVLHTEEFLEKRGEISGDKVSKGIEILQVRKTDFEKFSLTVNSQGIAAVFRKRIPVAFDTAETKIIVLLEDISDPGNLGTILRNCDWFGIRHVILNKGCVDVFNPKVIRSTAGAIFHVNTKYTGNFKSEIEELKKRGFTLLCADLEGESVFKLEKAGKAALVISSEAHGPSSGVIELSDKIITIPKRGSIESLNAASASAVLLAELTR